MSHHRYQSTGSYTPVLIRPSRSSDAALLRPPGPPPRLKYPYPIPIISLLDLSYTIHASRNRRVASHFLPLAIGRTLILLLAIGSSTRWRVRGGWVAVCSAVTVLGTVWEVCKDRLDPAASDGVEASDTAFLIMTATMAILQYVRRFIDDIQVPQTLIDHSYSSFLSFFYASRHLHTVSILSHFDCLDLLFRRRPLSNTRPTLTMARLEERHRDLETRMTRKRSWRTMNPYHLRGVITLVSRVKRLLGQFLRVFPLIPKAMMEKG
ncbi:hypothetical protein BD324DRAFT_626758 [Kockovaella imperatae]|uniref:Uncharacterized protein n=1 Tax=Kockovaella imperatae TaxID=4999 RepID=A0A1Y1UGM3_9TREE|nr:hypothetical protein BD324DRAFT_626758 [Kockovaella imperatae]ORX36677.1 hypothetical protein BD324DRAFT_626758 [Kockovaella imperatae]